MRSDALAKSIGACKKLSGETSSCICGAVEMRCTTAHVEEVRRADATHLAFDPKRAGVLEIMQCNNGRCTVY